TLRAWSVFLEQTTGSRGKQLVEHYRWEMLQVLEEERNLREEQQQPSRGQHTRTRAPAGTASDKHVRSTTSGKNTPASSVSAAAPASSTTRVVNHGTGASVSAENPKDDEESMSDEDESEYGAEG
ncbi:unnamed protein product, partial [Amoebophrya sp. A25]